MVFNKLICSIKLFTVWIRHLGLPTFSSNFLEDLQFFLKKLQTLFRVNSKSDPDYFLRDNYAER